MSVVVIDYGSGNLRSVAKAFERMGAEVVVTDRPEPLRRASRVVLPGVGAFADCKRGLEARPGLRQALQEAVIDRAVPFLGICVGMQLMADWGREHGDHPGLGWIGGEVTELLPDDPSLKVPQIGWNELDMTAPHPLTRGIAPGAHAYFVHSYHFRPSASETVLASTDYGGRVAALVGRDNLAGSQFHPEKSQAVGLRLIANFLAWRP